MWRRNKKHAEKHTSHIRINLSIVWLTIFDIHHMHYLEAVRGYKCYDYSAYCNEQCTTCTDNRNGSEKTMAVPINICT